nr:ABC transporter ATP-binding protein/permease [Candidatus Eremiobacteraeota bacterium]
VVVTFLGALARMVAIDWLLTVSLFVIAPIISYAVAVFNRLITTGTVRSQNRIANLSSTLTEVLHAQRIVKAFGRENYEIERFTERNNDYFGTYMKLTQFIQTQPLIVSELVLIGILAIVWFSSREVLSGRLDSGLVIQYWTLIVLVINPMNRFAAFVGEISKALVGAGRVFEVLDLPVESADRADAATIPNIAGQLFFENVTFSYGSEETPVLSHFDARVEAGEVVALVGPSGAGKTTIINLVPRFYEPQSGRILLDGVELSRLRRAELRAAIAIVPQETQLFRGTITENIRYGRLNASDPEVRAAAHQANAEEFINAFPQGYDTEVGERGVRLSGGQRQRIAIARAILRDPRILILDEATSALDSHSEALIEDALDRLLPGRTTLIIAHRLATIRRASKILYIEAGCVRETGTHESLLAAGGAYAKLHAAQYVV